MTDQRRFVTELTHMATLLGNYPVAARMAWVTVMVHDTGFPIVEVQLAARRVPEVAAALIEWERTLAVTSALVWRLADGHGAKIVLAGINDDTGTPIVVQGGPVPYQDLSGVTAGPGQRVRLGLDYLHLWAIDLTGGER